jgi:molecular chaperone DnaJ
MRMQISLEEAVAGTDKEVQLMHNEPCPACNGTGSETKKLHTCKRCNGSGQLQQMSQTVFGQFVRMTTCNECMGRGRVAEKKCPECKGSGHNRVKRTLSVHFPAGIDTGMRLRMEGYGEAGDTGAPSGDLFIEVHVRAHNRFIRTGDTLETTLEISPAQAVLGSSETIETIDNKHVDLSIPAGVQHNTALKIPAEGVKRRGKPGDLLVRLKIVVPKSVPPEQREFYQKILEAEGKKAGSSKKGIFSGLRGKK